MVHVVPDMGVVGIQACRQTEPRWDTDRRCCDAVGESDTFTRNAVQIWCLHPITAAAHRVPPLLICHQEKNVWGTHHYPRSIPASVKAFASV